MEVFTGLLLFVSFCFVVLGVYCFLFLHRFCRDESTKMGKSKKGEKKRESHVDPRDHHYPSTFEASQAIDSGLHKDSVGELVARDWELNH